MIFFIGTKCKIRFTYVGVNCKTKNYDSTCKDHYCLVGAGTHSLDLRGA